MIYHIKKWQKARESKTPGGLILISCIGMSVCSAANAGGPFSNPNKLGDLMMVMTPAYALGMTFMAKDYSGMLQLGESILAAQIASEGIKALEIERRPNGSDYKSFPSGHAVGVFSGAMFVHKRYGWKPALVPYAMGIVTGWSRVSARAHYWHDVVAGAAISALFTWVLVDEWVPKGMDVSADAEQIRLGFHTTF